MLYQIKYIQTELEVFELVKNYILLKFLLSVHINTPEKIRKKLN